MTTIKTTCPDCADVELRPDQVRLYTFPANDDIEPFYSFACPICGKGVTKPADRPVIVLLATGGVHAQPAPDWPRHDGPAIDEDDLIRFGLALEASDVEEIA